MRSSGRALLIIIVICITSGMGLIFSERMKALQKQAKRKKKKKAIPVQVARIKRMPITLRRTFSGTLEAHAKFFVAPKVSGRIKRLYVDIADMVKYGQVIAELDDDEYVQGVAQAQAEIAVSKANLIEAKNALIIANRELSRAKTLSSRGIGSASQLDIARNNKLEKDAHFAVAQAQLLKAQAALKATRIRLGYTRVTAKWSDKDRHRFVAERFVDEGSTVSATTALMSIITLNPITGVIFVTEKNYSRLKIGQEVMLYTDAFPNESFHGTISRIAPIFKQQTRQARVEISIENPQHNLKPGLFVRVIVTLEHIDQAIVIHEQALTKRNGEIGVFVVKEKSNRVHWHKVKVGITEGNMVEVKGIKAQGSVVILGQHFLDNGSQITIPEIQNEKKDQKP